MEDIYNVIDAKQPIVGMPNITLTVMIMKLLVWVMEVLILNNKLKTPFLSC